MIAAIAADPDCDPDGTVLAFLGSPSNATKNNLKLIFLFTENSKRQLQTTAEKYYSAMLKDSK